MLSNLKRSHAPSGRSMRMLPIFVFAKVSDLLSAGTLELVTNTAREARPVSAIEKTNTISH